VRLQQHTFNDLYDSSKQLVISSDSLPREIPTLEERLRSRFEWGLIADIQPPDLETKAAILRKKAQAEGVRLPDEVSLFIAKHAKSNIRELEGCLVRLVAHASFTNRDVSLELAQEVLKDLTAEQQRLPTIPSIQKAVADASSNRAAACATMQLAVIARLLKRSPAQPPPTCAPTWMAVIRATTAAPCCRENPRRSVTWMIRWTRMAETTSSAAP
jgi:hypothetical protein